MDRGRRAIFHLLFALVPGFQSNSLSTHIFYQPSVITLLLLSKIILNVAFQSYPDFNSFSFISVCLCVRARRHTHMHVQVYTFILYFYTSSLK